MTLAQIRDTYRGKWVLIEYHRLDRSLEVVEGDVIADASTKEDIYKLQMTVAPGKNLAIEYCGDWPTDVAVMFWLKSRRTSKVRPTARVQGCRGWPKRATSPVAACRHRIELHRRRDGDP
jgi:hypothetical protein